MINLFTASAPCRRFRGLRVAAVGVATVALSTTAAPAQARAQAPAQPRAQAPAQAPANAEPTYQVKLLVDPGRVLGPNGLPLGTTATALSLGASSGFELAQYMDDDRLSLARQDWIIRIRRGGDGSRLCLTYKRRFGIDGDGTDPAAVRRALERAHAGNFDASDTNYEPQVNLSYSRATLDFCNKKREPVQHLAPGELPGPEASRALTRDRLPGKLRKWAPKPAGWAESVAARSLVHGPVRQTNYPGRLLGHRLEMQVTPLRTASGEPTWFTEITAKAATLGEAVALRCDLLGTLRAEGWLLEREAFKTNLILAAP